MQVVFQKISFTAATEPGGFESTSPDGTMGVIQNRKPVLGDPVMTQAYLSDPDHIPLDEKV
jgi:hypothetical protein